MTHLFSKISNFPLAFGGAAISGEGAGYGFGTISDNDSIDLLKLAFERGFRIFDTAPIYGFGLSEKRMGIAFKHMREKVFLVSKSGVTWHENRRVDMTNDPKITLKMLEQSLTDLQTDYIDLYMIHWPDAKVDIRRPMEVLAKAKTQGKIKHIGLCNTYVGDLDKALEIESVEVVQSQFNFFENELQKDLFPFLLKNKIDFMSWGTLDKGILTGRVNNTRKFDKDDCRSWAPWWKSQDHSAKFKAMEKILPILKEEGFSPVSLALAFNLSFKEVSVAICGARNIEQLESLVMALQNLPPKELILKLQEVAKMYQK
jgi:aryl-alcohol dehydrogenase-like predicted oxidoreductase